MLPPAGRGRVRPEPQVLVAVDSGKIIASRRVWCLTRKLMQEKARFLLKALQITVMIKAWLYRESSDS